VSDLVASVVIPTHNRRDFLERAVKSVLAQSEPRLEVIVVDDASSDATAAYLASAAATDSRIRVLRNEVARGGGGARNVGLAHARAPWVAFLDDDDEWLPNKLQRQCEQLARHPEAIACSASFVQEFPGGRTRVFPVPEAVSFEDILAENVLGGASVCVASRQALEQIQGFDPRLRSAQDYDLWIRLRERGPITACAEPLVRYREHDGERITNQTRSQYLGSRLLFIKHRRSMSESARRRHLAFLCAVKARQPERSVRARLRYLRIAVGHAPIRAALSYGVRGVLSMVRGSS
jgi:glycosyltransferase involved in cell wall biosynthesis